MFYIAWRKLTPDIGKTKSETSNNSADASESWAKSNQMAVDQLIQFQKELENERRMRMEADKKITDLEIEVARQGKRIKRLEAQVISMGKEPVQ